jgi:hypothetical protein
MRGALEPACKLNWCFILCCFTAASFMMASSLLIEAVDDGGGAEWMLSGEHAITSQETSQRSSASSFLDSDLLESA